MKPYYSTMATGRRLAAPATFLALLITVSVSACSVWPAGANKAYEATLPACLISQNGQQTPLRVEVASTPDQRQQGLMDRTELAADRGMLFTYEQVQPANHAFWMYRTRIPLDIAYLDEADRIAAIVRMAPCDSDQPSRCPTYPAGVSFQSALEVNQGFFQSHHIAVGDRLELGEDARCEGNVAPKQ